MQANPVDNDNGCAKKLAMIDNYHLHRKNATFDFIIWHGQPWGGRFQMSVVGERQVTGWIGRGPPGQEAGYLLNILAVPPFNF